MHRFSQSIKKIQKLSFLLERLHDATLHKMSVGKRVSKWA